RTSLAQVVAEELRVPLTAIRLVMADTALTPYDMGTFGSMSTPAMAPQLRKAAAAARELLLDMAAERGKIERKALVVADGKITNQATKQAFSFGELTEGKKLVKAIGGDTPVTPAAEWKVEGTSPSKVNARDLVTGRHRYASDMKRPGMLVGKMLRPDAFNATLVSLDARDAASMPGVTVVHEKNFIGVAAANEQLAERALATIKAEWKVPPQLSSQELYTYLKEHPAEGGGRGGFGGRGNQKQGDIDKGLAAADHKLEATYTIAYIAHCPLEPRAALAEWRDGKLTVWTGTHVSFGVRRGFTEAVHLQPDKVRVIVPDLGPGYGGKHTGEAAIEAARLARAAGHPVKLVWAREEEFAWAYFRPAGVIDVKSGARADGTLTAWEFHTYNCGASGIRTPYDVANQTVQFHPVRSPLRQGSYRALAATA